MTHVLLFHHAQGLTNGVRAFAGDLRAFGHTVTLPDLYDGLTFDSINEGVAYARSVGVEELTVRGVSAAECLPHRLVYGGFSLGTVPAQQLAQTRPGALGALLYQGAEPLSKFGGAWPHGVALQIHVQSDDVWSELDVAETLAEAVEGAELFVYPGSKHLVADNSVEDYDPIIAKQLLERTLTLLARFECGGSGNGSFRSTPMPNLGGKLGRL